MARTLRRPGLEHIKPLTLGLPALVAASTAAHWLAARRIDGLWIMPDEAIYAERALALWRHGSLPVLHGQGAGYGLLYPVVAGLPLSYGSLGRGLASLRLLQSLVMSLAAVPVFVYGRRLMAPRYALAAAALAVCSPLLLYSGFVMTEVLFYPLAAVTLLAIARAVETATLRDQVVAVALIGAAVATRAQAIVFVAVLAAAVLLDALLARDRSRLRAFWPTWGILALGAVTAAAAPGVLGAYAQTLRGSYPLASALRLTYYHLAYLCLMTAVLPLAALGVLLVEAARGREREPGARALLAVATCAVAGVSIQVGFFAARYAPHLLGRDLAPLPPILFLVLALWLARGARRPRVLTASVGFAVLAVVALAPWNGLTTAVALPDSFELGPLYRAGGAIAPANLATLAGLPLLIAFALVPRRLAAVLPVLVATLLVAISASASGVIAGRVRSDQDQLVGSPRDWVDRAVVSDVTYLYDGEQEWNVVWHQRLWNRRITHVVSLAPSRVPGPMAQASASARPDGALPIRDRYVVASDRHTFVGTPVAHQALGRGYLQGLTLWRLNPPARLSTVSSGVQPNGDIFRTAAIVAYDCRGGRLALTLLPKATDVLGVALDGHTVLRRRIGGRDSWYGTIPVPASHAGNRCRFTIHGGLLLGSTVRAFERPS